MKEGEYTRPWILLRWARRHSFQLNISPLVKSHGWQHLQPAGNDVNHYD